MPDARRLCELCSDVEPVAADLELVAVDQRRPFDPLAVDEQAVEAAVVQGAKLVVRSADDQRVAARYGRVVELDVGRAAAPDPGPAVLERHDDRLAVLLEGDVLVARLERRAYAVEPGRKSGRGRDRVGVDRGRLEHRGAAEARPVAGRAAG